MEYLNRLIKEALEELKNNVQNNDFDDLEDLEDEYSLSDDELNQLRAQEKEQTPQEKTKGKRGSAYRHDDRESAVRNASAQALNRYRTGLPYAKDNLGKMWDTSANIKYYDKASNGSDNLKPGIFGRIRVRVVGPTKVNAYDFPITIISLYNIDPEDCKLIYTEFESSRHTEHVTVPKTRKNYNLDGVSFIVNSEYIKVWVQEDAQEIVSFLTNMKDENGNMKYFKNEQEIQNLKDYISNRCVTGREIGELISAANRNNIEMYNAFIEAENDEDIAEYMKLYSRNNLINQLCTQLGLPVSFGKIISMQNASLVLGSGRLTGAGTRPTFILTEREWEEHFKRTVNPNAVPFFIYVPSRKFYVNKRKEQAFTSKPYDLVDKDGNKQTISSTSDVLNALYFGKKWNELSSQQKIAAAQMCNYINPSQCYMVQEFDVSDTTPIDPNNDIFEREIGLTNRLTGELNAAANEFIKQQGLLGNETSNGEEGNEDDNLNAEQILAAKINSVGLSNIDEYCNYNGINYTKVEGDDSRSIVNALTNIARDFIPLRRKENIDILAGDAVFIICKIYRIALDVANSIRRGKPTDQIEFNQCVNAVLNLAKVVDGSWKEMIKSDEKSVPTSMVSEDVNDDNQSDFKFKIYSNDTLKKCACKMLGIDEKQYNLYEQFNSLLENMDKSKTNLIY